MVLKISLLLIGLGMTMAYRAQHSLKSDEKIEKLHSETLELAEGQEGRSAGCFAQYNPRFNQIVQTYEKEYDGCINDYKSSSSRIEDRYYDTRKQIGIKAESSCQSLKTCTKSSTAHEEFECAATWAAEDAKVFYEISANATDAAARIKADFLTVDTTKTMCINEAERNYVENTSKIYAWLNDCLSTSLPYGETTTDDYYWRTTSDWY